MTCGATGLLILAEQNAWLAAWGPRPGEPDCRVPPALLPESQTRRENAYLLWRSTVRVSTDAESESRTVRKRQSRRRNDAEQPGPARPGTRRSRLPVSEPDGVWIEHPRGRADLSALSTLSQAGGFDQVDVEAAALITASARYWTSRTTCLSDSRSFSAPAVVKRVAALCGNASKAERGTWTVRTPAAEDRGFPSRHQHSFPTAYSH